MYYQQPPSSANPNQPQPQGTRMVRPNMAPGSHPQISPNLAASPAHQQMGIYPHPGSSGPIPFSPQQQQQQQLSHGIYSQQMMTPLGLQQPHSQQMSTPIAIEHAPTTPATPQQLQQPHSIGSLPLQQPGSVQMMQQPNSIGPIPSMGAQQMQFSSNFPSAAPSSVGSTAGRQHQQQQAQAAQQLQQTQAAAQNSTTTLPEQLDPIASARMLILRDLRRAIVELNTCAEKTVECIAEPSSSTSSSMTTEKQPEEKKSTATTTTTTTTGGPHSNLGPGGPHSIGPQSNLGFGGPHSVNPYSVQNPLSVQNPQSVNPQSVSALPPGSVKSTDELGASGGKKETADLPPKEQYEAAKDCFLNVCDNIERNMHLILEVNRQQGKLYNPTAGSAVAWLAMPADLNAPTSTLPQVLQGFTELMNADKEAIRANIAGLNELMAKTSGKK